MTDSIPSLKKKIHDLKARHADGKGDSAAYAQQLAALERKLVDAVLHTSHETAASPATTANAKPPFGLMAGLFALIVLLAGAGYAWKGSPDLASGQPPVAQGGPEGMPPGTPHSSSAEQITAMTEKLAARLKEQPEDVEGWTMLARSYTVLGRHDDALKAYERAIKISKGDASLLADYADIMAVKNNGSLAGAPMKQVEAALKIDPRNIKALALAGSEAFDRKDFATAIKYWEKVVQFGPPESPMVQQIQGGLDEARSLSGSGPLSTPQASTPAQPAAAGKNTVSGTVTLSPALRAKASPEDTVFVFARAIGGSRMPLAIIRKQVKDLPITFTLDESTAMAPTNTIVTAGTFTVGARVTKTGSAMPQPGDLAGQSGTVKVGTTGIQIEIKEEMKQ